MQVPAQYTYWSSSPLVSAFLLPLWGPCDKRSISSAFYYMSLGVLSTGALLPGSFHETLCTISKGFLDMSLGVPIKVHALQVPLTGPLY